MFVAAHVDDAMRDVDAGVDGLDGAVDAAVLLISADDVIAHRERYDLLEVEHVLDNHNRAAAAGVGLFVRIHIVALGVAKFRYADANAELLTAIGTLKHQRLAGFVLCSSKIVN